MCSTVLCAFWHMGFDLSLKLYYILFIILLILWNTSLYSYWVSQLHKIKSHQSCAWKSVLSETNTKSISPTSLPFPWLPQKMLIWFCYFSILSSVGEISRLVSTFACWILFCGIQLRKCHFHVSLDSCMFGKRKEKSKASSWSSSILDFTPIQDFP